MMVVSRMLAVCVIFSAAGPQAFAADPEPRVVEVNGTALHYVDEGRGVPVVFVHGSMGTLRTWDAQLTPFAAHYRVIAYSRRFHPPNPAPADSPPYSMSLHVEDLAALIDRLGLKQVHLVANSYGAYTSLLFATRHPKLVRSLSLIEPPVLSLLNRSKVGASVNESFTESTLDPSRDAFHGGSLEDGIRAFVDGINGKGTFDGRPAEARAAMLTVAPAMRLEMITNRAEYMPELPCGKLRALKVPMLLIGGDRSPAMFHLIVAGLEECLDGEEFVLVPGSGHNPQSSNPTFYNEKVLFFLKQVDADTR